MHPVYFFLKAVYFHLENLMFFHEDCPFYLELSTILQKHFQTLSVGAVNVIQIARILAVPPLDSVASLLTIVNVKVALILDQKLLS